MTPFAWAIILPHGDPALKLDHAKAIEYAADHHGTVEALVLETDAIKEMISSFKSGGILQD